MKVNEILLLRPADLLVVRSSLCHWIAVTDRKRNSAALMKTAPFLILVRTTDHPLGPIIQLNMKIKSIGLTVIQE